MTDRIIAIDGPAGSGKSSVSRSVAAKLDWTMLDTGAMYRAITWAVLEANISPSDADSVTKIASSVTIDLGTHPQDKKVFLNDVDVTQEIRSPEVTASVSAVSAIDGVRKRLVELQRQVVRKSEHGIVIEGRDIGSVVLPEAKLKIFLTADPRVRAQRRSAELGNPFTESELDAMEASITERDQKDSTREISPLVAAADAIVIDTSDLSQDQVVDLIVELARDTYSLT